MDHADAAHADAGTMVVANADAVVHTTARADADQKNAVHANAVPAVVNLAIAVVTITERADVIHVVAEL